MTDVSKQQMEPENNDDGHEAKTVSRREFLKIAGVAGAAVGVGGGLGGLIAACGEDETTTTAGATTTTGGATTTAGATTTTTAGPETGREIKIGVVSPVTGIYAVFAIADKWSLGLVEKHLGPTILCGDGKLHPVSWTLRDTQSDINRASQVAADFILNDNVDLMIVGGGPDTGMPVADQCETLGRPLIATNVPWQAWVFGRGKAPDVAEKWVYGFLFGIEQATAGVVKVYDQLPTNKKVGLWYGNTVDSVAWLTPNVGIKDTLERAGYTTVYPQEFNQGTEDFTAMISEYKREGCELIMGSNPGKDFPIFWRQCLQQSYNPKVVLEVVGLASYEDQVALGDASLGIVTGFTWHKSWPYTDNVTGMTNAELADDYEATLDSPWNIFITGHARFGWALDILQRVTDFEDREKVLDAIKTTKLTLCNGPIDMTEPVDLMAGKHVTPNIYKQPWGFGQIEKGTKYQFQIPLIAMVDDNGEVQVDRGLQPMVYS